MTILRPLGIALIPALFGGIGTYELLRSRSSSNSGSIDTSEDEGIYTEEDTKPTDLQKTYLETFKSENLKVVDNTTTDEQLGNILLGRMFPNYRKEHNQSANQLFTGSPEITLKGSIKKNSSGKEIFILDKNTQQDLQNWKNACIEALNQKPTDPNNHSQKYRLKEWCTVSTVKQVLLRHKFKIPDKDEQWKEILKSEWITNSNYSNKQSFLTKEDLEKLKETSADENAKVKVLKDKCTSALNKEFKRTNFPAPKDFLDTLSDGSNKQVDEFQEVALLCTVPTTAQAYVQEAMKGTIHGSLPGDIQNDYCYDSGKEINNYKDTKTTDPLGGKSFWCAVRIIYHKSESSKVQGS